jgi:phosphate transport system substrate-binding protein
MRNLIKISFLLLGLLAIFTSCHERQETAIKGYLKCYVDESLYNIVKAERDTFVVRYPQSKIDLVTVKAREGITAVFNGEAKLFISSRELNDEEKTFFDKQKSQMKGFKFCYDAVVPIVQENDPMEKITIDELKKALTGETHDFNVIIPERNSGVYEYLKEKLLDNKEPQNVSIASSEKETISKVKSGKKSLGFVGINTLSGVTGVKILEVASSIRGDGEALYYRPYVAYLATESYPLVRTTAIFINDYGIGLAAGFSTFITSYDGQKIVSQNNLGPATVPVKMVELNRR